MEGVRLDHLVQYLGEVAADGEPPLWQGRGAERAIRLGGAGTPEVPEFAVVEVATTLGLTQPAATVLCADVLDLAYRLPRLASAVRAGVLGFSRARVIARRTRELSREQAALVQERLCQPRDTSLGPAPVVAVVAMSRLRTVVDQAVITVRGPESQAEAQARVAASLFVQVSAGEPGAADVAARLEVTDAVRLDRRLDQIAGWLTQVGDSRPKAILRAVALGLLADPALLRALEDLRKQHRDTAMSPTATSEPNDVGESSDVGTDHATASSQTGAAEPPTAPRAGGPPVAEPPVTEPAVTEPPDAEPLVAEPSTRQPRDTESPPHDRRRGSTSLDESQARLSQEGEHAPPEAVGRDEAPRWRPESAAQEEPIPAQEPVVSGALPPPAAADPLWGVGAGVGGKPADGTDDVTVAPNPVAGVAGCPPGLLEKFAGLTSTVLYLHLDQASGTWCEERGGVLTPGQARAVVGHAKVSVRPVLDLAEPPSYTGYVAPPRLKEQLALLNAGYCPFPYCHRRARAGDVDHQVPYRQGGPTATPNTHLPCRKHHRAKDKAGWKVTTPTPGVWIWTSPAGAIYLVTNGTTTQLNGIDTRTSSARLAQTVITAAGRSATTEHEHTAGKEWPDSERTGERERTIDGECVDGAEWAGDGECVDGAEWAGDGECVDGAEWAGDGECVDGAERIGDGGRTERVSCTVYDERHGEEPLAQTNIPDRSADTRTDTKDWAPSWDPWDDIDPLTRDEHDVTYGFLNTA